MMPSILPQSPGSSPRISNASTASTVGTRSLTKPSAVAQNQFIRIVLSSKRNASMPLANKRVWASWACT